MTKNPLLADKYFLQQHTLCRKYLHAYNLKKNDAELHQLRVVIKKIKAVLKMLNKLQPMFKLKEGFAPYKNIFTLLAPIREEHLQKEKLKKDKSVTRAKLQRPMLAPMLNKELKKYTSGCLKATENTLPAILYNIRQLEREQVISYCKKLLKKLKPNWKEANRNENLHQFRKKLKQFLYCSKLLTAQEKDDLIKPKKLNRLDTLQEIIGQWHDNNLLITKISKDAIKVSPQFLTALKMETKGLTKKILTKGHKLW